MTLSGTLKIVNDALKEKYQSIRDIEESTKLARSTVENCLQDLVDLGVAEERRSTQPSGRKNGWSRVQYRQAPGMRSDCNQRD